MTPQQVSWIVLNKVRTQPHKSGWLASTINPWGARMSSLSLDTSLEAARIQHQVYRNMPPEKRLDMACQMSDAVRSLSAAGVRARHPEYTDREVELAVIRLCLGETLFRLAYPDQDVVP